MRLDLTGTSVLVTGGALGMGRLYAERALREGAAHVDLWDRDAERLASTAAELAAMEEADLTLEDFLALDSQFHVRFAEAAGNVVVSATMAGLRETIESYIRAGAARVPDWNATATRLRHEHGEILAAIERGDAADARRRVRAHITDYYADAGLPAPTGAHDSTDH